MISINIKGQLGPLQRAFVDLRSKQAPFAMALALTSLAKGVEVAEDAETLEVFKSPTPFTQRAFAIQPATKSKPIAIVFPKDIQEQYLLPYVIGGPRYLGPKKGMLVPVEQSTNQYGNLPRNAVSRLLGKPGVFKGTIVTKTGKRISGIWQRTPAAPGKRHKGIAQPKRPLKLLIAFEDTTPAPKHFNFEGRARAYLRANAAREFSAAMQRALATGRR